MNPVKKRRLLEFISPTAKLHRESRAILTLANNHAADADNASLAGVYVALQIAVVAFAIGRRHQHLDVLSDCSSSR